MEGLDPHARSGNIKSWKPKIYSMPQSQNSVLTGNGSLSDISLILLESRHRGVEGE